MKINQIISTNQNFELTYSNNILKLQFVLQRMSSPYVIKRFTLITKVSFKYLLRFKLKLKCPPTLCNENICQLSSSTIYSTHCGFITQEVKNYVTQEYKYHQRTCIKERRAISIAQNTFNASLHQSFIYDSKNRRRHLSEFKTTQQTSNGL